MLDFCIYLLYRAGTAIASALPLAFLFRLGELWGWVSWWVLSKYRGLTCRNLAIAFAGEKSPAELRRIGRRHFQLAAANLLCSIKLGSMPPKKVAGHLEAENFDVIHRFLRNGTPVILLLNHIGNWEGLAPLFSHHVDYARVGTVYQKLGNRFIDEHVRRTRERPNIIAFDRADGFHGPIELLRSGGLIGILGDQHAGDHGLWTPFFGRLASTSPLSGLLAKRTGAAVVAAAAHTVGTAKWRVVFTERIDEPGDSVAVITAKCNAAIERQIRAGPEDWFWIHNRWKTPRPDFLLAHYKRGIFLPPAMPPEQLKPFRILVRAPNWLGDSVIAVPAVRAMKAGRPDAHITIAAPAKIAAVWKLVPEVDEVLPIEPKSLYRTVKILRAQQAFDVAVLLPSSLRVALEAWLSGVSRRVGFAGHHRRWLLNQVIPEEPRVGPTEHQVYRYLRMARALGGPDATAALRKFLPRARGNGAPAKLALCPGAEYGPAKRWLPERFAEVATSIADIRPVQWILFGTAADTERGAAIESALGPHCVNRIGKTTLDELITELGQCALLLTNDTGTMHLATLIGVPVVAIFGSTEPRLTGPLGTGDIVLRHQVECSPCFLRECPIDFRCMKAVNVEEVALAVAELLGKWEAPLAQTQPSLSPN
ncbi:MAG TPA: lipopolysaccharide heptosyltransferase II [Chthoniobacterales bacterium]|jgi:lipopolysaccharide heptosyltransferase II|nr:lipopolysaccharide heptosyltransferase II [Chthoniobacterales bacterium]